MSAPLDPQLPSLIHRPKAGAAHYPVVASRMDNPASQNSQALSQLTQHRPLTPLIGERGVQLTSQTRESPSSCSSCPFSQARHLRAGARPIVLGAGPAPPRRRQLARLPPQHLWWQALRGGRRAHGGRRGWWGASDMPGRVGGGWAAPVQIILSSVLCWGLTSSYGRSASPPCNTFQEVMLYEHYDSPPHRVHNNTPRVVF
jgi:hypothetical protein